MYHQGGPYPPAEGTQYAGRNTDERNPPQWPGANMGLQYAQSQAHNPPMQNNAQVNFVQPSQNQPHQYDHDNYPPNVVKRKVKNKPKWNPGQGGSNQQQSLRSQVGGNSNQNQN